MRLKKEALFFLCLSFFYLLLLPLYIKNPLLIFLFSLLLPALFYKHIQKFFKQKQKEKERVFLHRFFVFLSTEMTTGHSLSSALKKAIEHFQKMYVSQKETQNFLCTCQEGLQFSLPLDEIFQKLSLRLQNEHKALFFLLAEQIKENGNLLLLLKQISHLLQEQISLEQFLRSEQFKQKTENLLLLLFPSFVAFLLKNQFSSYMEQAFLSNSGQSFLLLSFFLNQIALFISLAILNHQAYKKKKQQAKNVPLAFLYQSFFQKFYFFIESCLPKISNTFLHSLSLHLPYIEAYKQKKPLLFFSNTKNLCISYLTSFLLQEILSLFLAIPFLFFKQKIFFFLFPVLLLILHIKNFQEEKNQYLHHLEKQATLYLHFVYVLLSSTYTPRKALEKAMHLLEKEDTLCREMHYILHAQERGEQFQACFQNFLSLLPPCKVQACFHLLLQFSEQGSKHLMELIYLQLEEIWKDARFLYKKEAEKQSFYLFLPMILSLLAMLCYLAAPAISQFTGIA